VKRKSAEGYDIIIAGEKNHPETVGTLGYCTGNAVVLSGYEEISEYINGKTLRNEEKKGENEREDEILGREVYEERPPHPCAPPTEGNIRPPHPLPPPTEGNFGGEEFTALRGEEKGDNKRENSVCGIERMRPPHPYAPPTEGNFGGEEFTALRGEEKGDSERENSVCGREKMEQEASKEKGENERENSVCGREKMEQEACKENGDRGGENPRKFALVFQTTFGYEKYADIIKKLEKERKTLEIFNTICYTTINRQKETAKIAKKCDCMIVVGDRKSSNTNKLVEIAGKYCGNVLFVNEANDIEKFFPKAETERDNGGIRFLKTEIGGAGIGFGTETGNEEIGFKTERDNGERRFLKTEIGDAGIGFRTETGNEEIGFKTERDNGGIRFLKTEIGDAGIGFGTETGNEEIGFKTERDNGERAFLKTEIGDAGIGFGTETGNEEIGFRTERDNGERAFLKTEIGGVGTGFGTETGNEEIGFKTERDNGGRRFLKTEIGGAKRGFSKTETAVKSELYGLKRIDKIKNLGIVTGASTSDELIMEVIFRMSKAQQQSGEMEAVNAAADQINESAVSNNEVVDQVKQASPKKTAAKKTSVSADGGDAEKKAADAAKKAEAAAKKAALAEKKVLEAEKKAAEAEAKVLEAEKKAAEAERKVEEAEKKTDISEIKLKLAAEKAEKAAAEKAEKAAAEKAEKLAAEKAEKAEKLAAENAVKAEDDGKAEKPADPVNTAAKTEIPQAAAVVAAEAKKPAPETAKKPVVKKPVSLKRNAHEQDEKITMEDVMTSKNSDFIVYKAGKKVSAIVINANEDGVNVAIGGKKDGFIDKNEMNLDGSYDPSIYKQGDIIDAVIIENSIKGAHYITLSKKLIDQARENDRVCEEILKGAEFELVCDKVVKGGITGRYGSYTVFVPASQIKLGFVKNLEDFLGKKLRLKALPPKEKETAEPAADAAAETAPAEDGIESMAAAEASANAPAAPQRSRSGKFIVASQKIILERERQEKEDEFWNSISAGDIVTGKVKRFAAFGAFVSVRGFDCLVHISDISWNRVADPSKVLEINGIYDFVVLKVDREANKISLGYKQLQRKPYDMAYEKFPVGSIVTGKVERIKDFGAFISLDEGVDGLVHVSQISHDWIKNANDVLKVGDEITAKVMSFDENKITLSMKELTEKPEIPETLYEDYGETQGESRENKFKKREAAKREFKTDGGAAQPSARNASEPRGNGANNAGKPRRERTARKIDDGEASEWVSSTSATTSLGDLFRNIKLENTDEE
jgi:4-hydroxy-3-methylbut-2-enyl diphosphate reductase